MYKLEYFSTYICYSSFKSANPLIYNIYFKAMQKNKWQ